MPENTISEVTRRNIIDTLRLDQPKLYGRLGEIEFLSRVFDLRSLPSWDFRFKDMESDIRQHTVHNSDWQSDWMWSDRRLDLLRSPDETFLSFLCELVHPVVRPDESDVSRMLEMFNSSLRNDRWELVEKTRISGKPVYAAQRTLEMTMAPASDAARQMASVLGSEYLSRQITRMEAAVERDPDLAIGTAKELIESLCKTILKKKGVSCDSGIKLPALVNRTLDALDLLTTTGCGGKKGEESLRVVLKALVTMTDRIAETRNAYGTGHGRGADAIILEPQYAKLVVRAAETVAVFLFESDALHKSADTSG